MSTLDELRALRKQEAWIYASLFTPPERQRRRRRIRLRTFATLAIFILAHFVLPWWAPTVGLILFIGVVLWRFSNWDRRQFIQAFFDLRRDVGSASTLTGKVHFAVVFVRHKHRAKNQVRKALVELESAFAYLQQQAQRYGKTVTFENVLSKRLHLVLRRPKTTGRSSLKDCFTQELGSKLAELPVVDMAANKNFFVIVLTSGGYYRACALPTSRMDDTPAPAEFCVCPETETAITMAHEILHLFGARDLYLEGESDDESDKMKDAMVQRAWDYSGPKVFDADQKDQSIMAHPVGDPEVLEIAPATAYSVGWLDKLPEPMVRKE